MKDTACYVESGMMAMSYNMLLCGWIIAAGTVLHRAPQKNVEG
jgi:hypothetical protein